MTEERRYTLAEAEQELKLRECALHGHSYGVVVAIGKNEPESVVCSHCDESWPMFGRPVSA